MLEPRLRLWTSRCFWGILTSDEPWTQQTASLSGGAPIQMWTDVIVCRLLDFTLKDGVCDSDPPQLLSHLVKAEYNTHFNAVIIQISSSSVVFSLQDHRFHLSPRFKSVFQLPSQLLLFIPTWNNAGGFLKSLPSMFMCLKRSRNLILMNFQLLVKHFRTL